MNLLKELEKLKIEHYQVDEDPWYSCPLADGGCADPDVPKGTCNCNAGTHNKRVDAIIKEMIRRKLS